MRRLPELASWTTYENFILQNFLTLPKRSHSIKRLFQMTTECKMNIEVCFLKSSLNSPFINQSQRIWPKYTLIQVSSTFHNNYQKKKETDFPWEIPILSDFLVRWGWQKFQNFWPFLKDVPCDLFWSFLDAYLRVCSVRLQLRNYGPNLIQLLKATRSTKISPKKEKTTYIKTTYLYQRDTSMKLYLLYFKKNIKF